MKREHKKHLIAAELRSAGGAPELLVRKVRAVDLPYPRKNVLPSPPALLLPMRKPEEGAILLALAVMTSVQDWLNTKFGDLS